MTIFDSLKYPISDRVTFAELNAIPDSIFRKFKEVAGYDRNAGRVYVYFSHQLYSGTHNRLLRKIIAEHEE